MEKNYAGVNIVANISERNQQVENVEYEYKADSIGSYNTFRT